MTERLTELEAKLRKMGAPGDHGYGTPAGDAIFLAHQIMAEVDAVLTEKARFRTALRIIAGEEQCIDNLMGNADVASAALRGPTA